MCEINTMVVITRKRKQLIEPMKIGEALDMFEAVGKQLKENRNHTDAQIQNIITRIDSQFEAQKKWLMWGLPVLIGIITTMIGLVSKI